MRTFWGHNVCDYKQFLLFLNHKLHFTVCKKKRDILLTGVTPGFFLPLSLQKKIVKCNVPIFHCQQLTMNSQMTSETVYINKHKTCTKTTSKICV